MMHIADIFNNFFIPGQSQTRNTKNTPIIFTIKSDLSLDNDQIDYITSSPATLHSGFSGSGYPFGSILQAFQPCQSGTCVINKDVTIDYPNSYYDWETIYPCIYFRYKKNGKYQYDKCQLPVIYPYRVMDYNASHGEHINHNIEPLDIKLYKSRYPNEGWPSKIEINIST
jgi:hypothetical protein